MLDFLDKLRQKPVHTRRQIAVVTTVVLSVFILSIWLNTWDVGHEASREKRVTGKSPTTMLVKGFSGIKEQGKSLWSESVAQISQVGKTTEYTRKNEERGTESVASPLLDAPPSDSPAQPLDTPSE